VTVAEEDSVVEVPFAHLPAGVFLTGREVVAAAGPQSTSYLQGQLSQDVACLSPGTGAWSWLLAPNGKVEALVRVHRAGEDSWWLDTDPGRGQAVLERLARFKLRTKVELSLAELEVIAVRGVGLEPGWPEPLARLATWPWVLGEDLLYERGDLETLGELSGSQEFEAWRVAEGTPRFGSELSAQTIPAESGLIAHTVSFTKGCYTGQELVARVDSRKAGPPRRLVRLVSESPLTPGCELAQPGGELAGTVTSAVPLAEGGWIGLGMVRRSVELPARLVPSGAEGLVLAQELPR